MSEKAQSIFIGYDSEEPDAYAVASHSLIKRWKRHSWRARGHMPFFPIKLDFMRALMLYHRPTNIDQCITGERRMFDAISDAPMSTEFAISRFLTPILAQRRGWALFTDSDVIFRDDPADLFELADDRFAVMVVKHDHQPAERSKMEGQEQTAYGRKNWSSVMLFNCEHDANRALNLEMINSAKGLDLHQFAWLDDDLIGALPPRWNHLVNVDDHDPHAAIAHFTLGIPRMDVAPSAFDGEWWNLLEESACLADQFRVDELRS